MTPSRSLMAPGEPELLDSPDAAPQLVSRNLSDIAMANRWLGGRRALSLGLRHALAGATGGTTLGLLDIGTGSGDLPRYCAAWAARRGIALKTVGLERIPAAARVAHSSGMPVFIGCASAVPLAARSVDLVLLSQVVHHFEHSAAVELLRTANQLARRAVIMVDLVRSRAARVAWRTGAGLLGFSPVTMADGLTSIDRGLTLEGAADLMSKAGVRGLIRRVAPFRILAVWKPDAE